MKSYKIKLIMVVIISVLFIGGYTYQQRERELQGSKPKDFNIVLNYGVEAKNQIDTINGRFTKDMITLEPVKVQLKLTEEEMNIIYEEIKKIDILNYPNYYKIKSEAFKIPHEKYILRVVMNGEEKTILWDENNSIDGEVVKLNNIVKKIRDMIENKKEYKSLPEAVGAYC
ncbi:MAG: hypothetical protein RR838_09810 [Clostridium sp.]